MKHSYTDDELLDDVNASGSIRQVLALLNIAPAGGNYQTVKRRIHSLNLDISHFIGQSWARGKTFPKRRSIEDYLSNEQRIGSNKLRIRLIKEKIFKPQCSACHRKTWLKNPIPLELEHRDGDSSNNRLDNLCLLCPNCHAQTSTYRGKNIRLKKLRSVLPV